MNHGWLQHSILLAASLLAPRDRRGEWIREWRSELWYIDRRAATRFCMGAFRDALWLRGNETDLARRGSYLESPLRCLALLATLAAVSVPILLFLPMPKEVAADSHPGWRDLADACAGMLEISCLLLVATLAVWRTTAIHQPKHWKSRLRWCVLLALKIALVQPLIFCGFMVEIAMGQVGGFVGLGIQGAIIMGLRWVFTDQQRRCPVCLRLLTEPVRIGTPSRTFLEWYGAESTCTRGHGLLHTSETSASYSARPEWLGLDESWSGLFAERS